VSGIAPFVSGIAPSTVSKFSGDTLPLPLPTATQCRRPTSRCQAGAKDFGKYGTPLVNTPSAAKVEKLVDPAIHQAHLCGKKAHLCGKSGRSLRAISSCRGRERRAGA